MKYEILDNRDQVINTIIADEAFVEANHPGNYRLLSAESDDVFLKDQARVKRNALLTETDWRFCSDLTPSKEWASYRQALRDVPSQEGFPHNIIWPPTPA